MGLNLDIRYRPMRVNPTMTTSDVIAREALCLRGWTLCVRCWGVNSQLAEKCVARESFLDILFREILRGRNNAKLQGGVWPRA